MVAKKSNVVIGYKGFDKDWKCRNVKYEVGKTKTHRGDIKLCDSGLHFCENPLDVLDYYDLIDGKFALVEATGVSDEKSNDSKRVAKSLHIKAAVELPALIKAGVDFVWESCKIDDNGKKVKADDTDSSKLASSGYSSKLASSGYSSKLASSGDYSQLASSGYSSKLASSGYSSKLAASGKDSVVAGIGYDNTAKATKGSWIVLAEWVESKPKYVMSVQVDGKKIKADTYYKLVGGKFKEVK